MTKVQFCCERGGWISGRSIDEFAQGATRSEEANFWSNAARLLSLTPLWVAGAYRSPSPVDGRRRAEAPSKQREFKAGGSRLKAG